MAGFQKHLLAGALASTMWIAGGGAGLAQSAEQAERLDGLFAELAEPDRPDWSRTEAEIVRLWSQSGSPAMDLLLQRASKAIEAEDYDLAIEHLSALVDHAPDFAEGWNARATAFFLMGEYSLSLADIEHVLALNPRHFGALEGLGAIFEELGEPALALRALRAAHDINPEPSERAGEPRASRAENGSGRALIPQGSRRE